jgi:hypothetical protein
MPRLPKISFLADPSPRTQTVCWVLVLIGIFAVMAGGIWLATDSWHVVRRSDADLLAAIAGYDTTVEDYRQSYLASLIAGVVLACLGVGLFHTWARNANCGWLSRLVRRFVGGYVRCAALLGLGLCAIMFVEALWILIEDEWWLDAVDEPFFTLYRIALCLGSGALAVLGYLYWYRPHWRKTEGVGRSLQG